MPSFFLNSQNPNNMSFRTEITAPIRLFRTMFSSHACLLLAVSETKSLSCLKQCSVFLPGLPLPPTTQEVPSSSNAHYPPMSHYHSSYLQNISHADYYFLAGLHFLCHNPQHSPQSHTGQDHHWVARWMLSKIEYNTRQITTLPLVSFGLLLYSNSISDHVLSGFQ